MTYGDRQLGRGATLAVAAAFALLTLAACGGGGGGGTMGSPAATGTEFADLNPTIAGYAASALARAADARPRSGSVTQSSNTVNGVTVDRVSVTAEYGASRNNYSIRNHSSWTIGTSDGNPVQLDTSPPFDGQELYKRTNGGTLYVDVYSDIEAPSTSGTTASPQTVNANDRVSHSGDDSFGDVLRGDGQGSLNGVPGTFSCAGSCDWDIDGTYDPASNRSSGTFNQVSGVTFTPDRSTTQTTPDTDYLAGGVWGFFPDNAASAADIVFGAFADGNDPFRQNNLMALQGSASYGGAVTGVYAIKSENEFGYWDGNVSLTANFGGRSGLGTIGGSVTGIEVEDELQSGSLNLGTASIGASNSGFFEGRLSGTVEGTGVSGRWGGQFLGNGEADGNPGSAVGTLGGTSAGGDGSFVGVFGAYKQ